MSLAIDSSDDATSKRRRAVELRLDGRALMEIQRETGLSAPTIIAAHKAFLAGGWTAVFAKHRGPPIGSGRLLSVPQEASFRRDLLESMPPEGRLWTVAEGQAHARERLGVVLTERTVQRHLKRWGLNVPRTEAPLTHPDAELHARVAPRDGLQDLDDARHARIVRCSSIEVPGLRSRLLVAQTARGRLAWAPVHAPNSTRAYLDFLERLRHTFVGSITVLLQDVAADTELRQWAAGRDGLHLVFGSGPRSHEAPASAEADRADIATLPPARSEPLLRTPTMTLTHLQRLEAESIHIMREVVAECERPVMLYSMGKDSACMLHLAKKAFYPASPPFPLLHVDTMWKFREMYAMRERMAKELGMKLIVWQNPEAKALGINPFDHGSQIHTDMWKTQGLKQALDHHGFDAAFGGARRDEEKSRAKERIFSFRNAQHSWDPKHQRPELWHLYNARKHQGESIRVFPLSNWTELDVWHYIHLEHIPIVPLYLARERPVVQRGGTLIMVDDHRMRLNPGEVPVMRKVRFRTLGCYPLSGAIESDADSTAAIIQEMLVAHTSEREGRLIDHDQSASMEKKKQEGYF